MAGCTYLPTCSLVSVACMQNLVWPSFGGAVIDIRKRFCASVSGLVWSGIFQVHVNVATPRFCSCSVWRKRDTDRSPWLCPSFPPEYECMHMVGRVGRIECREHWPPLPAWVVCVWRCMDAMLGTYHAIYACPSTPRGRTWERRGKGGSRDIFAGERGKWGRDGTDTHSPGKQFLLGS